MQVASNNDVRKWITKCVIILTDRVVIDMATFGEFSNHAFFPVLIAILHINKNLVLVSQPGICLYTLRAVRNWYKLRCFVVCHAVSVTFVLTVVS